MVTVFIIVSGENWNDICDMYAHKYGAQYTIYFIQLILVGNFMLLNLFLAILLKYVDLENKIRHREKAKQQSEAFAKFLLNKNKVEFVEDVDQFIKDLADFQPRKIDTEDDELRAITCLQQKEEEI